MKQTNDELPVIQRTYDLVCWYVPILNRPPRDHRFNLGDRIIANLYELLEGLIAARYGRDKLGALERLNFKLELLRYQTRLLADFGLLPADRREYAARGLNEVGAQIGAWIASLRRRQGQPLEPLAKPCRWERLAAAFAQPPAGFEPAGGLDHRSGHRFRLEPRRLG